MGSFIATSMITTLLITVAIGAVLVFVILRIAKAGGGGTKVGAMADPVPGSLLVTAAAMPSRRATYHMTRITGVVSGEGVTPTAVQYSGLIRTSLWPSPGSQLPVIVDRADPRKFAIQWDQAGASQPTALDQAEALAAAMRSRQNGDGA